MENSAIENKFCAFIDILGFKNKIKNFEEALEYYKAYYKSCKACGDMHDSLLESVYSSFGKLKDSEKPFSNVSYYSFSDSVIFLSSDWKSLLFKVANVMAFMLDLGFLFRGGIGYGKHYENISLHDMRIVSEGLVYAVETESTISCYPRIVIHKSAIDEIYKSLDSVNDLDNLLIQSEDDFWFINPFFFTSDIRDIYEKIKKDADIYKNEKFANKYYWMIELCEYFIFKDSVRKNPQKYYNHELNNLTYGHMFFYPKIYQFAIFGKLNYSLDKSIYENSFKVNINNIINQASC